MSIRITMSSNGWSAILSLVCNELIDEGYLFHGNVTTTKLYILKHMMDYFNMHLLWKKSWVLSQLETACAIARNSCGKSPQEAFDIHIRHQILPTLEDCIGSMITLKAVNEAQDYMTSIAEKCQPAHIRLPSSKPGSIDLKEPTFEPVYNREPILVQVLFTCLRDITGCVNYYESDYETDSTMKHATNRMSFYEGVHAIFVNGEWPPYITEAMNSEIKRDKVMYNIFSDLLNLEVQCVDCNKDLCEILSIE